MKYRKITDGIFIDRPNRFIAHVDVNGGAEQLENHRSAGRLNAEKFQAEKTGRAAALKGTAARSVHNDL